MTIKSTLKLLSIAIALSCTEVTAQINPEALGLYREALLFSQSGFNGSARIQAIGGAQVALGGDISSATSNPAGLGFFKRSQFSFSPSLNFLKSDANFDGNSTTAEVENFNINQLGVVINKSKEDSEDGFYGGSFAISLARTNSFKQEYTYDGFNDNSSIIDYFTEQANGLPFTLLENENQITNSGTELLSLAYNNYLINPITGFNNQYDSFILGFPRQQETIKLSGSQYQWNFAGGGNYKDKLYFGGGLGIATLNYDVSKVYSETEFVDSNGQVDNIIDNIQLKEEIDLNGIGVNLTVGVIFRPINTLTAGLSYVSPTWYRINDETFTDLSNDFDGVSTFNGVVLGSYALEGRIFSSNYSLRTPSKLNFGLAYFFGRNGFITGDVELLDYSNANLNSDDFSTSADNQTIRNIYKRVINFRAGTEYRIDNFRLRAGYALRANPADEPIVSGKEQSVTFGVGYRNKRFFADLGVINTYGKTSYSPYFLSNGNQPTIAITKRATNVLLTVGLSF